MNGADKVWTRKGTIDYECYYQCYNDAWKKREFMDIPDSGSIEIEVTSHSKFDGQIINGRLFSTDFDERDKWIYNCFKTLIKTMCPSTMTLSNYVEFVNGNEKEFEDYKLAFLDRVDRLFPSTNNNEVGTYITLYGLDYLKQSLVNN
jgi:hypothetical protein